MVSGNAGKPRGILNLKEGEKKFQLARHLPSPDLAFFVEHYWIVRWDLRGQKPYMSETLPHPSIHVVFEKDQSRIVGVVTGKFSRTIEGKGQVFGIKFRPGAFYPFAKFSVSRFKNQMLPLETVFDVDSKALEETILSWEDAGKMTEIAEQFLRRRLPQHDEKVAVIHRIIDCMMADREVPKVDDIADRLRLNKRTLQRLFHQYVGVSPKWVIKRYRLHEAAEKLASGEVTDWPIIALDLGYFDQAHFIKDFKAIIGKSPAEYAKKINSAV